MAKLKGLLTQEEEQNILEDLWSIPEKVKQVSATLKA